MPPLSSAGSFAYLASALGIGLVMALGAVHRRFRTPFVSIVVHGILVAALATLGGFIWNVLLAAVARLGTYAAVCGALPVLRARYPEHDRFRLPAPEVLRRGRHRVLRPARVPDAP
jgi:amino acid transporter